MVVNYNLDLGLENKKKRKPFPKTVKDIVRIKVQGNKCAICNKPFTSNNRAQYDHKNGKKWDNRTVNCQAVHAGCHDSKSRKQTTTRSKKVKSKKRKSKAFSIHGIDPKKFF